MYPEGSWADCEFWLFNLWRSEVSLSSLHFKLETWVFFFFSLFIFSWRIVALQCCVGFCHTSTWISHRYTYIPSLLSLSSTPSQPSRLSQSTGLSSLCCIQQLPCSCVWHMVIHIFQCYSLKMSHPLKHSFLFAEFWEGLYTLWRRRQWHPTPVLLPGKSHGRRSLVGCGPWGR